jgi:hypothetical protein
LINQISAQADATELGGRLSGALANRLRITRAEVPHVRSTQPRCAQCGT